MNTENDKLEFFQFTRQIGYDIGANMAQNVDLLFQRSFVFMPEMAIFAADYIVKKSFKRPITTPQFISESICFYFKNVFGNDRPANRKGKMKKPFVRIFPASLAQASVFVKNDRVKVVAVFISADYLKSFLREDAVNFQFLFDQSSNFWMEEIMTDDILRTVNTIVNKDNPATLKSYHYKLKAMELLFYLFQSLGRREKSEVQKLSRSDISTIYKVRDQLVSSLQQSSTIAELKQKAGMNELKMRRLFKQIFGMGLYDYYQHLRMREAARLLREEKLSVSEAGYQMGFENLSHFSRMFEKHIGKKPKKYSSELA